MIKSYPQRPIQNFCNWYDLSPSKQGRKYCKFIDNFSDYLEKLTITKKKITFYDILTSILAEKVKQQKTI